MNNLKQIGTLLLCGLLFMRVMVAPVIYFSYEFNKAYIIENYCINKNRPQLHCDGKCYLAKKLQVAQEKEETQSKISLYKLWIEVFHQASGLVDMPTSMAVTRQEQNYCYHIHYTHTYLFSLLKPPKG